MRQIYFLLDSTYSRISINFIPGTNNLVTDAYSRKFLKTSTEWSISESAFHMIKLLAPEINFDLFASYLNHKLLNYWSWHWDPHSSAIDAFTGIDWNSIVGYAFPPFRMIMRCLRHIQQHQIQSVYLIVPLFRQQPYLHIACMMLLKPPIVMPRDVSQELRLPWSETLHLLRNHLQLILMNLSGTSCRLGDSLLEWPNCLRYHGGVLRK